MAMALRSRRSLSLQVEASRTHLLVSSVRKDEKKAKPLQRRGKPTPTTRRIEKGLKMTSRQKQQQQRGLTKPAELMQLKMSKLLNSSRRYIRHKMAQYRRNRCQS